MAKDTMGGLPLTVERILLEAAHDDAFRQALLDGDRLTAVEQRGHQLGPSERAMLEAVPRDQLAAVLEQLRQLQPTHALPPDVSMMRVAGIRPDGSPVRGIRPDGSPVRGSRPGRLLLGAAVTAGAVGAAVVGTCLLMAPAGSRPDLPPRPAAVDSAAAVNDADAGVDGGDLDSGE